MSGEGMNDTVWQWTKMMQSCLKVWHKINSILWTPNHGYIKFGKGIVWIIQRDMTSQAMQLALVFFWIFEGHLPYWGRDKMADILQTTLANWFSCKKIVAFWYKLHSNLFLMVQLTVNRPNRRQTIIWTNHGSSCWRVCVSPGLDELISVCIETLLI